MSINTLISSEQECLLFIRRILEILPEFNVESFFQVAYSDGDIKANKESPNAATSVVIRIVQNCDPLAMELSDNASWLNLKRLAEKALIALVNDSIFNDVLPLKTMGVLPIYSTCYLGEIFGSGPSFGIDIKELLTNRAYAVVMRKILFCVYKEIDDRIYDHRQNDGIHPFLLYRCTKVINKFNNLLQNAYNNNLTDEINLFFSNFKNIKLLRDAKKIRKTKDISEEEKKFTDKDNWREFNKYFIDSIIPNSHFYSDFNFRMLISFLEERALNEALAQVARKSRQHGPEMDAAGLAFSLGILADIDKQAHFPLISQGLQIVLESCNNGQWDSIMPFHIDDKGRAIYVPSIEVANVVLSIYLNQMRDKITLSDFDLILSSTDQVQRRLCEHDNSIEIYKDRAKKDSLVLKGWCTDKAPSYKRIDSWVTAHVLAFFLKRFTLIQLAKKDFILKKYSWTKSSDCLPKWDEIVDPDEGLIEEDKRIKNQIEKAFTENISERDKALMFILYGPPGTAKTTLVQGIANKLEWDLVRLSPSNFISDGIDKIEEYSRTIFEDLMNLDKCVILMDEMDSLFRDREILNQQKNYSPLEFIVPAFLPKLQRLRDYVLRHRMAVFLNTNYFETIDNAIIRGGRFDYHHLVLPYSKDAKLKLIAKFLSGNWVIDGYLTDAVQETVNNIFDSCSPILVYREIEQLGKLIMRKWPDPKRIMEGGEKIEKIEFIGSINPQIFTPFSRPNAFREVCALIDRINNAKPESDYSFWSRQQAISFLKDADININEKHKPDWYKFKEDWLLYLTEQNTKFVTK